MMQPPPSLDITCTGKVFVATLGGVLDDRLLGDYAAQAVRHPDYNRCVRRVIDIRGCTRGQLTADGVRAAFALQAKHSGVDIEVVVLSSTDVTDGPGRGMDIHAGRTPFALRFTDDEDVLVSPQAGAPAATDVVKRLQAIVARGEQLISGSNPARVAPQTSFHAVAVRELEQLLFEVRPDFHDMYAQATRAFADGHYYASMATLQEMLRRVLGGDRNVGLADALTKVLGAGEFTKYLVPLIQRHVAVLRPSSIGNEEDAAILLRIVRIILVYRVLLPHQLTQLFDSLESGGAGPKH